MKQESNRQKTMEGIDGDLDPTVDGQHLSERGKMRYTMIGFIATSLKHAYFHHQLNIA